MEHACCRQRVFECVTESWLVRYFHATWLSRQVGVRDLPLHFIVRYYPLQFIVFVYDFNRYLFVLLFHLNFNRFFNSTLNVVGWLLIFSFFLLDRSSKCHLHCLHHAVVCRDRFHFLDWLWLLDLLSLIISDNIPLQDSHCAKIHNMHNTVHWCCTDLKYSIARRTTKCLHTRDLSRTHKCFQFLVLPLLRLVSESTANH